MIRLLRRLLNHLPPRADPLPNLPMRRAAQEAYQVAQALRSRPNAPTTLHAHTLADIYDLLGHQSLRIAALEEAEATRGVAQAYERTLP